MAAGRYNSNMRLFYAAYLSRENMHAYQALVDRLIEEVPGTLRSIPPETYHLTLAFLEEIAENGLGKCIAALEAVGSFEAFSLSLGQPRVLKGRGRPRLICVDVTEGTDQVSELQKNLRSHLIELFPSKDVRPKPPHVTLARFKKNSRSSQARRVDEALARHCDYSARWKDRFSSVHLVKSSLTPSGPIYETVKEVRLFPDH